MMRRGISTGDLLPVFRVELTGSEGFDIGPATRIRMLGKLHDTDFLLFDRDPDDVQVIPGNGIPDDPHEFVYSVLTMDWQPGDTDHAGRIDAEVEVQWDPGGKPMTIPVERGVPVRQDFDQQNLALAVPEPGSAAADAFVNAVLLLQGSSYDSIVTLIDTISGLGLDLEEAARDIAIAFAIADEVVDRNAAIAAEATARDVAIAAAAAQTITDLVNGAPGALDRFNEFADALGNDPNFATTMATQLADLLGAVGGDLDFSNTVAGQLAALDASIETQIEDAAEVHIPGSSLGSAKFTSAFFDTTSTAPGASALIPGLVKTVTGTGRPIDIDFTVQAVRHLTVAPAEINGYLEVNGSVTAAECQSAVITSVSTTKGRSMQCRALDVVLLDGVEYTFKAGIFGAAATPGTLRLTAATFASAQLALTAR